MRINDTLDPLEYPLQKGMTKEYAITLFVKQLKRAGINYNELTDVDVWYSNDDGYYKLSVKTK